MRIRRKTKNTIAQFSEPVRQPFGDLSFATDVLATTYWKKLVDEYARRKKLTTKPTALDWEGIYGEIVESLSGGIGRPKSSRPKPLPGLLHVPNQGGAPRKEPELVRARLAAVEEHKRRATQLGRRCSDDQALRELYPKEQRADAGFADTWAPRIRTERRRQRLAM